MHKIRHKKTGKFLSHSGHRHFRFLYRHYSVETFLSAIGKTWGTEKGVNSCLKDLDAFYPGEFEVVEYGEKNVR